MSATTNRPSQQLDRAPEIGTRIAMTGTWRLPRRHRPFRGTELDSIRSRWNAIETRVDDHAAISVEVGTIVGGKGVIIHLDAVDADALVGFLHDIADELRSLRQIADPGRHMVRGIDVPHPVRDALDAVGVPATIGRWSYGFVTEAAADVDPETAVEVTATWRCTGDDLAGLERAWRQVATDALDLEPGLVRFEAHAIEGEDALVVHETFASSDDLKFHLTKGTAAMHKKDIDRIAAPDAYLFRGPVAWSIRTYSKLMRLPASYAAAG